MEKHRMICRENPSRYAVEWKTKEQYNVCDEGTQYDVCDDIYCQNYVLQHDDNTQGTCSVVGRCYYLYGITQLLLHRCVVTDPEKFMHIVRFFSARLAEHSD